MDALSGSMCMIMNSVFRDQVMLRPLLNRKFTEKLDPHRAAQHLTKLSKYHTLLLAR